MSGFNEVTITLRNALDNEQAVKRVRELHQPVPYQMNPEIMVCQECKSLCHSHSGIGCDIPTDAQYPCWTIKALDGEQS